jgi:hypothetical protein
VPPVKVLTERLEAWVTDTRRLAEDLRREARRLEWGDAGAAEAVRVQADYFGRAADRVEAHLRWPLPAGPAWPENRERRNRDDPFPAG